MKIELKILNKDFYQEWLPTYATNGSAAVDLCCTEQIVFLPGQSWVISTGIAIHIGSNQDKLMKTWRQHWDYAGLIIPRSSLGTKGLILANTIGLIDADYTGELKISAWNRNNEYKTVGKTSNEGDWEEIAWNNGGIIELNPGDRIAQLMIIPIARAQFEVVTEFSNTTERGDGGFGSTGK